MSVLAKLAALALLARLARSYLRTWCWNCGRSWEDCPTHGIRND